MGPLQLYATGFQAAFFLAAGFAALAVFAAFTGAAGAGAAAAGAGVGAATGAAATFSAVRWSRRAVISALILSLRSVNLAMLALSFAMALASLDTGAFLATGFTTGLAAGFVAAFAGVFAGVVALGSVAAFGAAFFAVAISSFLIVELTQFCGSDILSQYLRNDESLVCSVLSIGMQDQRSVFPCA